MEPFHGKALVGGVLIRNKKQDSFEEGRKTSLSAN